jgi:hypothetical protein
MDALKTWVLRSPLIQAFLLTVVAMGIQLALTTPVYATIDDVLMTGILTGNLCSPEPSDKILFTNIIIARLLKSLYVWQSAVPWYGLYLIATHIVSFLTLSWACLQLVPGRRTILLLLLYLYGMETECLRHLNFTTTSYLAGQSGIMLILVHLARPEKKNSYFQLGIGFGLLVLSSLIRLQMFQLVMCLSIPLLANILISLRKPSLLKRTIILFGVLGIVVKCLAAFNDSIYSADPGWRGYSPLFRSIAQIVDYSKPNSAKLAPQQAQDILSSVGWSFNDFAMLSSWCFTDKEVYSAEKMEIVGRGWRKMQLGHARISLYILLNDMARVGSSAFCIGCMFTVFGLRSSGVTRKRCWGGVVTWGLACGLLAFLSVNNKVPERIYVPILMFAALATVVLPQLLQDEDLQRSSHFEIELQAVPVRWLRHCSLSIAVVCFIVAQYYAILDARNATWINRRLWHDLEKLEKRHDHLVIAWLIGFEAISPYDDLAPLAKIQLFPLSPFQRTPHGELLLQNSHIQEPLKALFERRDVMLIAVPRHLQQLQQFIKDHYRRNVQFQRVLHGTSGLDVYQSFFVSHALNL